MYACWCLWFTWFLWNVLLYGVFTLPDTDTDFTFTDTGTDTDTMGFKPNCIGVGVGVGQCEHTIRVRSHFTTMCLLHDFSVVMCEQ